MSDETAGRAPDDTDWEAVARYLAGESTAEESAEVERWLAEDPDRREEAVALAGLMDRTRIVEPADLDVEAALANTRRKLAEPAVHSLEAKPEASWRRRGGAVTPARTPLWAHAGFRAAAAIVLLVGAALLFRALFLTEFGDAPAVAGTRYATATGERQELVLADGTRALLGPLSELSYEIGYGDAHHTVELTGDGYFEVPPGSAGLFTVRTGRAVIRDLGTAFTVQGSTPGTVEVVVTEGSVSLAREEVGEAGPGVVLHAGDRGEMDVRGEITVSRGTASADDLAWTRGELVFREAPMPRVAAELSRWYGIELRIPDAGLAGRRLTASFAGESADEVARIIGLALGAEAVLVGDTLVLRSTGAAQ